jgi:putative ABC transport system substrate-binding protein
VRRRELIGLGTTAFFAWPLVARAQQAAKVWRIGYLRFSNAASDASNLEALRAGLRALGHVEGKNLVMEFRWAETVEQLQEAAAELVRMFRLSNPPTPSPLASITPRWVPPPLVQG